MKDFLFSGSNWWDHGICFLRFWCGVIFIRYGLSVIHADSVRDFANTLATAGFPVPLLSAYLCKSTEFLGGICFMLGFLIRPSCIFLIIDMLAATFIFHHGYVLDNGLTTFLLMVALLDIFFSKADLFTIDHFITTK